MGEHPNIFVSYSHADTRWLTELDPHLKGLQHYANIENFDDRRLVGGDAWDSEVRAALDQADIVVLLVTANFIGSEYIHRVELPTALRKRADAGCVVIPVLLETCFRKLLQIDDLNYLPKDDNGRLKPLAEWDGANRAKGLTQIVENIHNQIERRVVKAARDTKNPAISGVDVGLYRRRAQAKWSAIDLSALAVPGAIDADIAIRLADVFVPQLARRNRPAVSLPRDYLEKQGLDPGAEAEGAEQIAAAWERSEPVSALALIGECREKHLVLLGDPGAGKSAMARFVLLQLLDDVEGTGSPLAALAGYVPFLIELRDFVLREAEGRCTDPLSYLAYCGGELGFGFDQAVLEHQFTAQPSLLIIDGLDEIFDPKRRRLMVDHIIGLAARYPKLRLFITSRIAGFDEHPFRAAEFALATLIDLTNDQIERFTEAWFRIVFPGDLNAATRARDDLLDAVRRRPQLRTIAGNPMILTIMATVARHKRLGRSRAALYSQALELLCYNWDYKRGLDLPPDSPLIDLQADDTLLMLRRIAWRMQEVPDGLRANAIDEASLRSVIEDFFEHDWHFGSVKARRAAREMLDRLQVRNWVLTLRGPALYGFVHRTFLEYLCALELWERFKAQQLNIEVLNNSYVTPRLDDDTWHEVLRLLLDLLPPAAAEQTLLALLPSEPRVTADAGRLVFAWQGLAEIEPRHIPTLDRICGQLSTLLYAWLVGNTTDNLEPALEIATAAQSIGKVAWPAPHPPQYSWPPRAVGDRYSRLYLIGVLGRTIWDCADAAHDQITVACSDPDPYYRSAVVTVLGANFPGDLKNQELFHSLALKDPDGFCRSTALEALAAHSRDDPRIKALLRARAVEDADQGPRSVALRALAEHFRDDPQTKALLRARVVEDADEAPRRAALWALAEHFRDNPQTKALLRARVVEDADEAPRRAALEALAQHFRDDPQTKALVRTCAIEDENEFCRGTALEALAQHFRDDPQTKALVRTRAIEDENEFCRGTALEALAQHFRDDPQTKALLRARAVEDADKTPRCAALLGFAQMTNVPGLAVLASKHLDSISPRRDPREPVTSDDIAKAAEKLGKSEEEVRALYQRLPEQVPLTFVG